MQPDDINAIEMISEMLLTAAVLILYGERPRLDKKLVLQVLCVIVVGGVVSMALTLPNLYSCDDSGNGPFYQANVAGLCIGLALAFVTRKVVLMSSCLFLFIIGIQTSTGFKHMVNRGPYTYANTYTGKPVNKACSDDPNAVNPYAVRVWHTSLTRIYRVPQ